MTSLVIMKDTCSNDEFTSITLTTFIKKGPFGILTQVPISRNQVAVCLKRILGHAHSELVRVAGIMDGLYIENHVVVVQVELASRKRRSGCNIDTSEIMLHNRFDLS